MSSPSSPSPSPAQVAYVAVHGLPSLAPPLAAGLQALGLQVAVIDDAEAGDYRSRDAVEQAFANAARQIGPADLVVHAAAAPSTLRPAALAEHDPAALYARSDEGLRATLYTLQAAHTQMAGRGGAVAVLGPALSLVGAAGLVPLATTSESQRSLVKSAARQWAPAGLRLNWIGIDNAGYAAELEGQGPAVPELGPPPRPLGQAPELAGEVAPVLAFLASAAGRAITGTTLNLDGGEWMTP